MILHNDFNEKTMQQGRDWYEQQIRHQVESTHHGDFVAIDVSTGDYSVAGDASRAVALLKDRQPDATVCILRVGYSATYRLGGRSGTAGP